MHMRCRGTVMKVLKDDEVEFCNKLGPTVPQIAALNNSPTTNGNEPTAYRHFQTTGTGNRTRTNLVRGTHYTTELWPPQSDNTFIQFKVFVLFWPSCFCNNKIKPV